MECYVETVHALPGRIRLRVGALRDRAEASAAAAQAVAAVPGVVAIRVHPFTATFLVTYQQERVTADAIAEALRDAVGARRVLAVGGRPPVERRDGKVPVSRIGRALMQAFHDANEDVLRATDGSVDLGVLAMSAFATLGAAEVVVKKKMVSPGWFNLAWWGFQTFLFAEGQDIYAKVVEGEGRAGERSPRAE
jgi:hypothetical protein